MSKEASILLFATIVCFLFSQLSVNLIGNRQYSMHYKSHGLVENKGIMKLIYFKPKHFHRYTLWEIFFFFFSYVMLIGLGTLFGLGFRYEILHKIGFIAAFVCLGILTIVEFIRVVLIDIQNKQEEKYLNSPNKDLDDIDLPEELNKSKKKILKNMLAYTGTIRFALDNLYDKKIEKAKNDLVKIENIDKEFIKYYRDYKKIVVIEDNVYYKK